MREPIEHRQSIEWISLCKVAARAFRARRSQAIEKLARCGRALLLGALLFIGLISFMTSDFAYQWQPVPADMPARAQFARVTGAVLIGMILGTLWPRWRKTCLFDLAVLLSVWLFVLQGVRLVTLPIAAGAWNSFSEIAVIAIAVWSMAIVEQGATGTFKFWRIYGLFPCVFGVAHFVYADITAGFVPNWIPVPLFWAYATGALHLFGGLMILTGLLADVAAAGLGLMYRATIGLWPLGLRQMLTPWAVMPHHRLGYVLRSVSIRRWGAIGRSPLHRWRPALCHGSAVEAIRANFANGRLGANRTRAARIKKGPGAMARRPFCGVGETFGGSRFPSSAA